MRVYLVILTVQLPDVILLVKASLDTSAEKQSLHSFSQTSGFAVHSDRCRSGVSEAVS